VEECDVNDLSVTVKAHLFMLSTEMIKHEK